jgi:hypothetical protein
MDLERQTIYVSLFDSTRRSIELPNDVPAIDFIRWLEGQLELAPAEYRDAVHIELGTTQDYDNTWPQVTLYYHRPETDEELAERQKGRDRRLALFEEGQRMAYEALKRKYDGEKNV